VYFIKDNNLGECPQLELNFAGKRITTVIDSGAEVSILSELFSGLKHSGTKLNPLLHLQLSLRMSGDMPVLFRAILV
jgi:hypothetical protein